MKDDKTYKQDVVHLYLRFCKKVHSVVLNELENRRSQVSITPSEFLGIFPARANSRNQLLRVKMFLDYEQLNPTLDEELRTYILLLHDEYAKINKSGFNCPYKFILEVPITQWLRYKSSFLPKPRILPQLAKDALPGRTWSLPRAPREQKLKKPQIRGYRDKGSAVPLDVKVRREASLAAAQEYEEQQLARRALALSKRMRISPTPEDVLEAIRIILRR